MVAAAVRLQNGGQNIYVGLYYWNSGSPELMLFKRSGGAWTQLGATYNSGGRWPPARSCRLGRSARTISFLQNGVLADHRSPTPA